MVGTVAACLIAMSLATDLSQKPNGFLAEPESGKGLGVLVLHPWWGLNQDVKDFCSRLAKEGFVVFAPDLFRGKVATTISEAEALTKSVKNEEVQKDISAATKYLFDKTGKPLSVVGFSYGAYYALEFSNAEPDRIKSAVIFYGTGHEDFSKSKASYLGHFAEKDEFEPQQAVDSLKQLLEKAKRPVKIHTYPGTGHWFFEPSRKDAYNQAAAELAWKRTVEFLKKT